MSSNTTKHTVSNSIGPQANIDAFEPQILWVNNARNTSQTCSVHCKDGSLLPPLLLSLKHEAV